MSGIMEILEGIDGMNLSADERAEMEMEIREVIARELENLLVGEVKPWGQVQGAVVPQVPWEILVQFPAIQQLIMRGAANCVRGKMNPTEADWGLQSGRMVDAVRRHSAAFRREAVSRLMRDMDDEILEKRNAARKDIPEEGGW